VSKKELEGCQFDEIQQNYYKIMYYSVSPKSESAMEINANL